MRGWISGVFALVAVCSLAAPAAADKRVALVVGNSAYQNVARLDNTRNDARLMAETLQTLGFTLVGGGAQLDLEKAGLDAAVQNFGNQLQGADVGLFYYAGHGVQVRGANYLVPVNANPTKEADVDFQLLDTNAVLRQMESAGAKLNLVILDACRNNPFGGRGLRAIDSGLAQMRAPEGTVISFATQPGNVAQDGADGNSPYTKALARTIRRPGLGILEAFNEVGLAVMDATGSIQQPWMSSSPIRGSFYFVPGPGGPVAGTTPAAPLPTADEILWTTIKDSNIAALFVEFQRRFPSSPHASMAMMRAFALDPSGQGKVAIALPLGQGQVATAALPVKPVIPTSPVQPAVAAPLADDFPDLGLSLAQASGNAGVAVMAVAPAGRAAERGFRVGDVILEISGKAVSNTADVRRTMSDARASGRHTVIMRVKSGEWTRFVAIGIGDS